MRECNEESCRAIPLMEVRPRFGWPQPVGLAYRGTPERFLPGGPDYDMADLIARFLHPLAKSGAGFLVDSGHFNLGWTQESVQLPHRSRLPARVEGKSSLARIGLGV